MNVKDTLIEIQKLEETNRILRKENDNLILKIKELKRQLDEATDENLMRIEESNRLFNELFEIKHMSMWEFADKYCSDKDMEEAGHALARSFGIGVKKDSFVEAEIASEKAEQETVSAMSSYLGDDY